MIKNKILFDHINDYKDFNIITIIDYLSEIFKIHKERILIKTINIIDYSNNIIDIEKSDYFILLNNSSYNIHLNALYNDTSNNSNYFCQNNNNLILENIQKIEILNNINNDNNIFQNSLIQYLIFKDLCKDNIIKNNPNQLFENYSTINELKNNIFLINDSNLINNDDCNYFVKLLNTLINNKDYNIEKWGNGSNVNCLFLNVRNVKNEELRKKIDTKIYNIINKIINYLYKEYDILCKGDSGYCLRKIYGATRQHKDGVVSNIHNNSETVYKNQIRNMSIIIALNDDYENGEFYFPRQNFKIKLKKGEIIIFPPYWTHPHFVTAPINNTYRYTINTWLYE